jgi:hypothetical protein
VNIVIWIARNIVVDYETDLRNVKTSGRNVSGDQDACCCSAETTEVVDSLSLRELGMKRCDSMVKETEEMVEIFGGSGAVAEDDDSLLCVTLGGEKDVKVVFFMGDRDLNMCLV